jgi:hypothetical protein
MHPYCSVRQFFPRSGWPKSYINTLAHLPPRRSSATCPRSNSCLSSEAISIMLYIYGCVKDALCASHGFQGVLVLWRGLPEGPAAVLL